MALLVRRAPIAGRRRLPGSARGDTEVASLGALASQPGAAAFLPMTKTRRRLGSVV